MTTARSGGPAAVKAVAAQCGNCTRPATFILRHTRGLQVCTAHHAATLRDYPGTGWMWVSVALDTG